MPRIKNAQQLHNAVAQFITAITPHVASVPGLTAGMLTTLTTDNGTLATTITAQIAAMEAAEAAKQARDNQATGVNNSFDQPRALCAVPSWGILYFPFGHRTTASPSGRTPRA